MRNIDSLRKAGEKQAGIFAPKTMIPSLTDTARYRFPDALTVRKLIEVKNVAALGFTNQLRDSFLYAQSRGLRMILWVRGPQHPLGPTHLTAELQRMVRLGQITLRYLK